MWFYQQRCDSVTLKFDPFRLYEYLTGNSEFRSQMLSYAVSESDPVHSFPLLFDWCCKFVFPISVQNLFMEGRFNGLRELMRPNISVQTMDARAHMKGVIQTGKLEVLDDVMSKVDLLDVKRDYVRAMERQNSTESETRLSLQEDVDHWKKRKRKKPAADRVNGRPGKKPRRSARLAVKGTGLG